MDNETEIQNVEPIQVQLDDTSIKELESSVTELVEAIKSEQELKAEEKVLSDEALAEEQQLSEEQQQILDAEKQANEEAEQEFRNQVLQLLNVESPSQIDYSGHLEAIISTLNEIKENQEKVSDSDHVISIMV